MARGRKKNTIEKVQRLTRLSKHTNEFLTDYFDKNGIEASEWIGNVLEKEIKLLDPNFKTTLEIIMENTMKKTETQELNYVTKNNMSTDDYIEMLLDEEKYAEYISSFNTNPYRYNTTDIYSINNQGDVGKSLSICLLTAELEGLNKVVAKFDFDNKSKTFSGAYDGRTAKEGGDPIKNCLLGDLISDKDELVGVTVGLEQDVSMIDNPASGQDNLLSLFNNGLLPWLQSNNKAQKNIVFNFVLNDSEKSMAALQAIYESVNDIKASFFGDKSPFLPPVNINLVINYGKIDKNKEDFTSLDNNLSLLNNNSVIEMLNDRKRFNLTFSSILNTIPKKEYDNILLETKLNFTNTLNHPKLSKNTWVQQLITKDKEDIAIVTTDAERIARTIFPHYYAEFNQKEETKKAVFQVFLK